MTKHARSHRLITVGLAAVVGFTTLAGSAPLAHADEVSPTGKGIAGGALLGGEVITITESLAGVHAGWAYVLGAGVGLAGGGVGGWAVEQAAGSNGQGPVYMLAGGLALVIPALVLTLNATRYRPSDNATEDHPPADAPSADPGRSGGSVVAPPAGQAFPAQAPAPTSLLDIRATHGTGSLADGFRMGLPVPEVRPMYSLREQAELGLPQGTELRFPVMAVTF